MSGEVVEAVVQIDSVITEDDQTQTEETPHYVPLVREVVIMKLQNELIKT